MKARGGIKIAHMSDNALSDKLKASGVREEILG
jgi:hypothetical protein